jgi:hypothetical protein
MTSDWCTKQHNEQRKLFHRLFFCLSILLISLLHICALSKVLKTIFLWKLIYYCKYLPWQENLHLKCILVCEIKAKKYGSRTINYSLLGETIKGPRQIAGQSGQWHVYYIRRCDNFLGDASAFRAISIDLRSKFRSN